MAAPQRPSRADRRLLDRRGIVVVDLSVFSTDHERAFDQFLSYLHSRKSRAADWPTVSADAPSWPEEAGSKKYADIVAEWRRQRGDYPGWVVLPEDRRRFLWRYTESWLSHFSQMSSADRARLDTPLDLDLAFELAWRLDRCLFPLIGELPAFLEEVAAKYSDTTLSLPEQAGWTRASVFEAIANIRLWLLRHYREEGLDEEWQAVSQALENDFARLLPEHRGLSRRLLEYAAAYQIQARAFRGLPPAVRRRLQRIAAAGDSRVTAPARGGAAPALAPGSRLISEWRGRTHTVDVLDSGFRCDGKQYRSLSEIARAITGARWSGPRFFGL